MLTSELIAHWCTSFRFHSCGVSLYVGPCCSLRAADDDKPDLTEYNNIWSCRPVVTVLQVARQILSSKEIARIWERGEYNEDDQTWILPHIKPRGSYVGDPCKLPLLAPPGALHGGGGGGFDEDTNSPASGRMSSARKDRRRGGGRSEAGDTRASMSGGGQLEGGGSRGRIGSRASVSGKGGGGGERGGSGNRRGSTTGRGANEDRPPRRAGGEEAAPKEGGGGKGRL